MPKTVSKNEYILLHEDLAKYSIDLKRFRDLEGTIKALSVELEARFRKPLKKELNAIVQSKDITKAMQDFVCDYYNLNGTPIKMSFGKIVELMELDMQRIYQLLDVIKGSRQLIFKMPQIEQYRYYARTPEQLARYKKLNNIIESIKELYDENKQVLNSRFVQQFAVGSSNTLLTDGRDLTINYKWVLNT